MTDHFLIRILIVMMLGSAVKSPKALSPAYYLNAAPTTSSIADICKDEFAGSFETSVYTFVIAQLSQNDQGDQVKFSDYYNKQLDHISKHVKEYKDNVDKIRLNMFDFVRDWIIWNIYSHISVIYKAYDLTFGDLGKFVGEIKVKFPYFQTPQKVEFSSEDVEIMTEYLIQCKADAEGDGDATEDEKAKALEIVTSVEAKLEAAFNNLVKDFSNKMVTADAQGQPVALKDDESAQHVFRFITATMFYFSSEKACAALFQVDPSSCPAISENEDEFLKRPESYVDGRRVEPGNAKNLAKANSEDSYRSRAEKSFFLNGRPIVSLQTLTVLTQFKHTLVPDFVDDFNKRATAEQNPSRIDAYRLMYHFYLHLSMEAIKPVVIPGKFNPNGHIKPKFSPQPKESKEIDKCSVYIAIYEFITSNDNCLNWVYSGDFVETCPLTLTVGVLSYTAAFPHIYNILKKIDECGIANYIKTKHTDVDGEAKAVKILKVWTTLVKKQDKDTYEPMPDTYLDQTNDEDKQVYEWIKAGIIENTWANLGRKVRKFMEELAIPPSSSGNNATPKNSFTKRSELRTKLRDKMKTSAHLGTQATNIILESSSKPAIELIQKLEEILASTQDDLFNFLIMEVIIKAFVKIQMEHENTKNAQYKSQLEPALLTPQMKTFVGELNKALAKMLCHMVKRDVTAVEVEGVTAYFDKTLVKLGAKRTLYYSYLEANMFRRLDMFVFSYSLSTDEKFKKPFFDRMKAASLIESIPADEDETMKAFFNTPFFIQNFSGFEAFVEFIDIFEIFSAAAFTKERDTSRKIDKVEGAFLRSYVRTFDTIYAMLASMRYNSAEFGFEPMVHTWKMLKLCSVARMNRNVPIDEELPSELCPLSYGNLEDVMYIFLIYMAAVDTNFKTEYEKWSQSTHMRYPAVRLGNLFSMVIEDDYFINQFENFCEMEPKKVERKIGKIEKAKTLARRNPRSDKDWVSVWNVSPICFSFDFVMRSIEFLGDFSEGIEEIQSEPDESNTNAKKEKKASDPKKYKGVNHHRNFEQYERIINAHLEYLAKTQEFGYYIMIWSSISALFEIDSLNDGYQELINRGIQNGFDLMPYKSPTRAANQVDLTEAKKVEYKNFYKTIAMHEVGGKSYAQYGDKFKEFVKLRFVNYQNDHLTELLQKGLALFSSSGAPYWEVGGKPIIEMVEVGVKYGTNDDTTFKMMLETLVKNGMWITVLQFSEDGVSDGEDSIFAFLWKSQTTKDDQAVSEAIGVILQTKIAEFDALYLDDHSDPIDNTNLGSVDILAKEVEAHEPDDLYINDPKDRSVVNNALEEFETHQKDAGSDVLANLKTNMDGVSVEMMGFSFQFTPKDGEPNTYDAKILEEYAEIKKSLGVALVTNTKTNTLQTQTNMKTNMKTNTVLTTNVLSTQNQGTRTTDGSLILQTRSMMTQVGGTLRTSPFGSPDNTNPDPGNIYGQIEAEFRDIQDNDDHHRDLDLTMKAELDANLGFVNEEVVAVEHKDSVERIEEEGDFDHNMILGPEEMEEETLTLVQIREFREQLKKQHEKLKKMLAALEPIVDDTIELKDGESKELVQMMTSFAEENNMEAKPIITIEQRRRMVQRNIITFVRLCDVI